MQKRDDGQERRNLGMEREDYLYAIYTEEKADGEARISSLAEALNVKKPSVSQMVNRLKAQGFLKHEPYNGLHLTPKGEAAAKSVIERREALTEFFNAIGVPRKTLEHDVHGIEHHLSPATLGKLRSLTRSLKVKK